MISIGLTGGIGSGKSVIAQIFKTLAIPVYNSDIEAKRLINSSTIIREQFIQLVGSKVYVNSILQPQILAQAIFTDDSIRQKVNAIVHPEVFKDFKEWGLAQNAPYVIMESALLLENNLDAHFNAIIIVDANKEIRKKRVMKRDNCDCVAVENRMQMQVDYANSLSKTSFVIKNNNTFVIPQVLEIHTRILNEING